MINNFKHIEPLLSFNSDDDYFFIQLMKRRKENTDLNKNAKIVKSIFIDSHKNLMDYEEEIVGLCKLYNARAYINLNRRSYKKAALLTLKKVVDSVTQETYKSVVRAFESATGSHNNEDDKKWIVDVDCKEDGFVRDLWRLIDSIQPFGIKKEVITLATKNGYHMICRPFNVKEFTKTLRDWMSVGMIKSEDIPDIKKDNGTVLYIP